MLTNGQKKALHSAARQAGVREDERRLIQRNVGGFHSAADRTATREGFIAVMAFLEKLAGGTLRGCTAGYWREQNAESRPGDSLRFRVRQVAGEMGWTVEQTDRFLASKHCSNGFCASVEEASEYWLGRLLDGLKAMGRRMRNAECGTRSEEGRAASREAKA